MSLARSATANRQGNPCRSRSGTIRRQIARNSSQEPVIEYRRTIAIRERSTGSAIISTSTGRRVVLPNTCPALRWANSANAGSVRTAASASSGSGWEYSQVTFGSASVSTNP